MTEFVGWYDGDDNLVTSSATISYPITENATYYARFTSEKTVLVEATGKSVSCEYDGSEHSVSGYDVKCTFNGEEFAESITFTAEASVENLVVTGMDAAEYPLMQSEDKFTVTNIPAGYMHILTVMPGTLTIKPKPVTITVTGNTDTRPYTGSEQSVTDFSVTGNPQGVSVVLQDGQSAIAKGTDASDSEYRMDFDRGFLQGYRCKCRQL